MFFHRTARLVTRTTHASTQRMQATLESPPASTTAKRLSVANSFNMQLQKAIEVLTKDVAQWQQRPQPQLLKASERKLP